MNWISAFLKAWGRALVDSLPATAVAALGLGRPLVAIEPSPGGWRVTRPGGRRGTAPAEEVTRGMLANRVRRGEVPVLSLPEGDAVQARLTVPETALRALDEIVDTEIARLTPFRADDVAQARRVGSSEGGQVRINLTVVPKSRLMERVAALRAEGVEPGAAIAGAPPGDGPIGPWLDGDLLGLAPPRARHGTFAVVLAVTLLLGIGALVSPLASDWLLLRDLDRQRMTLATRAATILDQADRLAAAEARLMALNAFRSGQPRVTTLERLTAALPDDTWLTELSVEATGRVVLAGLSRDAAGLLRRLAATPDLTDVAFTGPVTRDGASGAERFRLSLSLASAGGGS